MGFGHAVAVKALKVGGGTMEGGLEVLLRTGE
jgi:hypothetical protein